MDESTTTANQLTRNWDELLQEIRVIETGVQILTGFLLTIPFTQRFSDLNDFQRDLYLVVLAGSVTTTALVVAPVAFHRALFRRHARRWLVEAANKCAGAGLVMMALTTSGAMFLIFDVVAGDLAGGTALVLSVAFFGLLWAGTPFVSRRRGDD